MRSGKFNSFEFRCHHRDSGARAECVITSHPGNWRRPVRYNRHMIFPPAPKALLQHEILRWLMWMRVITLTGQCAAVAIAQWGLGIDLPLAPMFTVLLFLAAFNAWTWWTLRHARTAGNATLFTQLFVDLLALSSLLFFSGGATNPFVSVYLPALAVSAAILPGGLSLILAAFSLACYSFMMTVHVPLPVIARAATYQSAGLWANFALSAGLITWFVARMSNTLRDRDAQLARAREQRLQNAQIVALGTQAASAAHEIGTPLATIAVLAGDLLHEMKKHPSLTEFRDDLLAIESQIAVCKTSLDRLGKHAQGGAAPATRPVALAEWLARFIEGWRLRHPGARLDVSLAPTDARIAGSDAVGQILLTLLDNAARAAGPTDAAISLSLSVEGPVATIHIEDRGPGIAPDILKRLGHEQVNSTTGGQGLGLMLAFATAQQIGAEIHVSPGSNGGTLATITLPLA
jgi:two-component system sensor histidine kinase RegB